MDEAKRLEENGTPVLNLNIGNPAPFGFLTPEGVARAVAQNLGSSQGYVDAKGITSARQAIQREADRIGIPHVELDDIYVGNGVSELIVMSMQGLLNTGDEVLVPTPDYPLWSAAIRLAGGVPVHYRCDEAADWQPDMTDLRAKTSSRTVAVVVINPNNPTGAVYTRELLEVMLGWARQHSLIVLADEIYSKITYDDADFIPCGSIDENVLVLTFDGLSKTYRAAGFRTGWMIISGPKHLARDYIDGLNVLAAMRLCSNVPTQHGIEVALNGYQSIYALTSVEGEFCQQRDAAWEALCEIDGIQCVKPKGALYLFPKIDVSKFNILDDEQFVFDLLHEKRILIVQGTAFNYPEPDHFRIVFLPAKDELTFAISQLGEFLSGYKQIQR
ncbi:MAG: pyridoxal phosphate-dependent aminotransferase [Gammaproteobacteria bacterium]|nr:pyridoxal phosphate-dependent aminotransferase [Gammaproteobacteria bacterium]